MIFAHETEALQYALQLAGRAASEGEVPVGAVVLAADGSLVGEGYNLRETRQSPIAHAEIIAIEAAAQKLGSWRLNECRLIVTLEPCPMCLAACQAARLGSVIYGATDPKGGALSLGYALHADVRTNHRFTVELHTSPECSTILSEFFRKKRAQK